MHALDATIAHMLQSPEENAEYLKALSMLLAQKGYAEVVRNNVLPTLSRYTKYEEFTALFHAVEQSSAEFLRSKQATVASVYSATTDNASDIFDAAEEEYSTFADVVSESSSAPVSTVQTLEGLIRSGQVIRATQLYEDLCAIGVDIPKSPLYSYAANRLLRSYDTRNAIEQYRLWLELVPDADQNPDHAYLDQLTGYLLNSHRPSLQLINEFSLICSRKGYLALLERTLPVIIRYTEVEFSRRQLCQWEDNVRDWFVRREAPNSEIKLWEAEIRGVAIRAYRLTGHQNEVVNLVKHSYNTGTHLRHGLVHFIIREWDQGADSESLANLQIVKDIRDAWYPPHLIEQPSSSGASQDLALLVEQRRYAEAEALRAAMYRDGQSITPSSIYIQAALATLASDLSPDRARSFHHWMELVPACDVASLQGDVKLVATKLLEEPVDVTLLMLFALHCARKGVFDVASETILGKIVGHRSIPSPSIMKLLDQLRQEFDQRAVQDPAYPPLSQTMFADAVSASMRARRVSLALQLTHALDHAHKDNMASPPASSSSEGGTDLLAFAQTLETRNTWSTPQIPPPILLRYLRRVFTPATSSSFWIPPPPPEDLYKHLLVFRKDQRFNAVKLLNSRAMRSPPGHSTIWARAMMLHAARKGDHDRVLSLFAHYFYMVGVYRKGVLEVFERRKDDWQFMQPRLEGRIPPLSADIAMVWHSLVAKSPDETNPRQPGLRNLYRQFIGAVKVSKGVSKLSPVTTGGRTILLFRPPPIQFDDDSFTPFISAFCSLLSPNFAVTVFKHMTSLGFNPTEYQLRKVACTFAAGGNVSGAVGMLDYLELHKERSGVHARTFNTYGKVLKAFLDAKCLEGAEEVERRLVVTLGYQPSLSKKVDRDLAALEKLRKEPTSAA